LKPLEQEKKWLKTRPLAFSHHHIKRFSQTEKKYREKKISQELIRAQ
jgi:hypothetical protein